MRFFPLIRDKEWRAPASAGSGKVIAASTRKKARDYIDLLSIEENLSPLGPFVMAAAGKPPHFAPVKTIEEIRRKALSATNCEYLSVRGISQDWTPAFVRQAMSDALDRAENYVRSAPSDIVGPWLSTLGAPAKSMVAALREFPSACHNRACGHA